MSRSPSSVRHTRAIQLDRRQRPTSAPLAEALEERLSDLAGPAVFSQLDLFRQMGLRARILTLPVMAAMLISLIWRQLGSVTEAVRVLGREGFLWQGPTSVSQQALSERFRTLPAVLFENVLREVLPEVCRRAEARQRPLDLAVERARAHFEAVVAFDGSTLDALMRKVGLLRGAEQAPLAGRMAALLDVGTRLPHQVWIEADPKAHDQRFWDRALDGLAPGTLVIFDRGLVNHTVFATLTDRKIGFITRLKKGTRFTVERVLHRSDTIRDQIVGLGSGKSECICPMRLVEVLHRGTWYSYLTNVLDPAVLSAKDVARLYRNRWRIEDAFKVVKRLLGLAYFASGSANAVHLQVWMTWVLYAVLMDLADEVAETLQEPLARISIEMVYRGLYHFAQAVHRGEADDPAIYLAENAKSLGILKRKRRPARPKGLTMAASP